MQYKLLEVIESAEDLNIQVNSQLEDGWELWGSPFVYIGTEVWKSGNESVPGPVWCQCLVNKTLPPFQSAID